MTRMTLQYFFMAAKSFCSCFLPSASRHLLQALVKAFFLLLCLSHTQEPRRGASRGSCPGLPGPHMPTAHQTGPSGQGMSSPPSFPSRGGHRGALPRAPRRQAQTAPPSPGLRLLLYRVDTLPPPEACVWPSDVPELEGGACWPAPRPPAYTAVAADPASRANGQYWPGATPRRSQPSPKLWRVDVLSPFYRGRNESSQKSKSLGEGQIDNSRKNRNKASWHSLSTFCVPHDTGITPSDGVSSWWCL